MARAKRKKVSHSKYADVHVSRLDFDVPGSRTDRIPFCSRCRANQNFEASRAFFAALFYVRASSRALFCFSSLHFVVETSALRLLARRFSSRHSYISRGAISARGTLLGARLAQCFPIIYPIKEEEKRVERAAQRSGWLSRSLGLRLRVWSREKVAPRCDAESLSLPVSNARLTRRRDAMCNAHGTHRHTVRPAQCVVCNSVWRSKLLASSSKTETESPSLLDLRFFFIKKLTSL